MPKDRTRKPRTPRFGSLTADDVCQLKLPDRLAPDLDIVFVGINPGLMSAYKGHHYAGHNNHFWPCLNSSGLVPEHLTYEDDVRCPEFGIGLTNIVERTTRGAADLKRSEVIDGKAALISKLKGCNPLVVCFNGKNIYETFSGKRCVVGLQDIKFPSSNAAIYVMPSSSGLTMSYPRWQDKLVFYQELKALCDARKLKRNAASDSDNQDSLPQ